MKKIVTLATSDKDANGDILVIEGVLCQRNVPILKDFQADQPLGWAFITAKDNTLQAEINVDESLKGLYPAVGFHVLEADETTNGRLLKRTKMIAIGLCSTPNANAAIGPI